MSETPAPAPRYLEREGAPRLAYHRTSGRPPTVAFLSGYASDMTGSKALRLERFCAARGQRFLRFDYSGHGASDGEFLEGTIGAWAEDARALIDAVTEGPLVLVGSSMGGWIMLLVALAMPARVQALIGVAAAPDFTEDLMWAALDERQRSELMSRGALRLPSPYVDEPYPITRGLIEEGRRHLCLRAPIPIDCPVRLLHGLEDGDVPWRTALRLADRLRAGDVTVTLVKGGGHRLSEPGELDLLEGTVASVLEAVRGETK